jgi:CO/xanthine dehydrogenase Mo-binding subunit
MRNILKDGDANPVGENCIISALKKPCARRLRLWAGVACKQPNVGRGLAIADQLQGAGQSTASVSIDASGQVHCIVPRVDTGPGAHTIMRQISPRHSPCPRRCPVMQDTDAVPLSPGRRHVTL